ncbi:hypothetical protein PV683_11470 [Streptomyces sp. AK08-01B]|nr:MULTISPECIES: hypothetical protein [unclassified Streptomyces]MDX3766365.1 hypothetical protein [Streptomyces sp. AK08-01B]MDX3816379.1 hypothetical protein [Streptomyces sp. AK08-01A]
MRADDDEPAGHPASVVADGDRTAPAFQEPGIVARVTEDLAVVVQVVVVFVTCGGFVPGGAKGRYLLVGPVFRPDERRARILQPGMVLVVLPDPYPPPLDSAQRRELERRSGAAGSDLCQKRAVLVGERDTELRFDLGNGGGSQDGFERRVSRRPTATGSTLGLLHCDDAFPNSRPVNLHVHGSPIDGAHGH